MHFSSLLELVCKAFYFRKWQKISAACPAELQDCVPLETLALVATVVSTSYYNLDHIRLIVKQIEFCLNEWETGQHKKLSFTEDIYSSVYQEHLEDLQHVDKNPIFGP